MATHATCPGCQSTLQIPDAATGKPVRCTRCKRVFTVPVETEIVFEDRLQSGLGKPLPPRPTPPPARAAAPARRPPIVQKPSAGGGWIIALIAGLAAALLLVCGGGAVAAWVFIAALGQSSSGPRQTAQAPTPTVPPAKEADPQPAPKPPAAP